MPNVLDWTDDVGRGWLPLLERLHIALSDVDPDYQVIQLKEKFGQLRVYLGYQDGINEQLYNIVTDFEDESSTVCELCGAEGRLVNPRGWYFTRCEAHSA